MNSPQLSVVKSNPVPNLESGTLSARLVEMGISQDHVASIQNRQKEEGGSFVEKARAEGVSSEILAAAQAEVYGYSLLKSLEGLTLDHEAMIKYGLTKCQSEGCLFTKDRKLVVGDTAYIDTERWAAILEIGAENIEVLIASKMQILDALIPLASEAGIEGIKVASLSETGALKYLDLLIRKAIEIRSTDVHLEPRPDGSGSVRYRRDGVLTVIKDLTIGSDFFLNTVRVVFNQAGLDLDGISLKFQDGKMIWEGGNAGDQKTDIRVSVIPTTAGPSIALRLLARDERLESLELLGYPKDDEEIIRRLISAPHGLLLMSGPTGSGKTTTLYAAVRMKRGVHTKIVSVEDPVEIELPGVQQVQINETAHVTWHSAIKTFLRQDPDVMLVGEIRDPATAKAAVQAAQTGHLLMSSVHANSCSVTPTRLINLEVRPSDLASELLGVVSQRLVRKVCPKCVENRKVTEVGLSEVLRKKLEALGITRVPVARGCTSCGKTGYQGRQVICEIMEVSPNLRSTLEASGDVLALERTLRDEKFVSLAIKALRLVRDGITTLEEVQRVEHLESWAMWNQSDASL